MYRRLNFFRNFAVQGAGLYHDGEFLIYEGLHDYMDGGGDDILSMCTRSQGEGERQGCGSTRVTPQDLHGFAKEHTIEQCSAHRGEWSSHKDSRLAHSRSLCDGLTHGRNDRYAGLLTLIRASTGVYDVINVYQKDVVDLPLCQRASRQQWQGTTEAKISESTGASRTGEEDSTSNHR